MEIQRSEVPNIPSTFWSCVFLYLTGLSGQQVNLFRLDMYNLYPDLYTVKKGYPTYFYSVYATAPGLEIGFVEGFQKKDLLVICLLQLCKTIIAKLFACFYVRDCKNNRF
jgi:hypothetical protein